MTDVRIDVAPDIDGYFEQVVEEAVRVRGIEATPAARRYLTGVLITFARGEQSTEALDRPLAFLLGDALAAAGADRFTRLRSIGDAVLYLLGFFGGLSRRGVDPQYAIHVGASAYNHASAMLRLGGAGSAPDVLQELAEGFDGFVGVMGEVADGALAASTAGASSIVRLYERWLQTGSARLADELAQLGVCPARAPGGVH